MIMDHHHGVIYACLSKRTSVELLSKLAVLLSYEVVHFDSIDQSGVPIYHTNVMMCLGSGLAVVCLDSIVDKIQRYQLTNSLESNDYKILDISLEQVIRYAGNMIQLKTLKDDYVMVMSDQARRSLSGMQIKELEKHSDIISADIGTIEAVGGGSARCMIAEIFLDRK